MILTIKMAIVKFRGSTKRFLRKIELKACVEIIRPGVF